MTTIVFGMLLCVALAVAVVLLVAVPARREGRDVLTERGEEVFGSLRGVGLRTRGEGSEGSAPAASDQTYQDATSS